MGNSHQMVVHHVGEIVGGIAVGLDQNHIVQLRVVHGNIPVNLIMEGGRSRRGIILADDIGHACRKLGLYLFFAQMKAVLIVHDDLLAGHLSLQGLQALLVAEAVISLPFFNQFLGILQVDARRLPLTLHIGTHASVLVRTLIMLKARFLKRAVDNIHSALHVALLVGILNTENKISSRMLCNQICIQRRS